VKKTTINIKKHENKSNYKHACSYTMDWDKMLWKCQGYKIGCGKYKKGMKREQTIEQLKRFGFDL